MPGEAIPSPPIPRDAAAPAAADARPAASAHVYAFLGSLDPRIARVLALVLVVLIAILDHESGFDISLGILYVVPIALVAWSGGRRWGYPFALISTVAWAISFEASRFTPYFWWDLLLLAFMLLLFAELLIRLRRALEHSDDRFVRVLEGIDAAVYVVDAQGTVLYANPRLVRLCGDGAPPQHASHIAERFVAQGEHAALSDPPGAWPDGTALAGARDHRRYVVQARDITWVDGRRAHLVAMNDVTAQLIAQELQRDHQDALHRTGRIVALSEATSTLAHELNQPLAAIAGYSAASARLLEEPGRDTAEVREALAKCHAQAVRAGEILKRLRELTRQRTPEFTSCDVNAMVSKALAWMDQDLERAKVTVDLALAPGVPPVQADRVLIEQVLLNLVQNAVDAMGNLAAPKRRLSVATSVEGDGATRVTISDRGPGIPPEVAERLFSPFFTTKRGGLGLGLSICRSIVEMHGGRIGHGPGAHGGTDFSFTLPRHP